MNKMVRVHGTCVALRADGGLSAVLLRGPTGAGKSDLALRLIDRGALLVADDLVEISEQNQALTARAPETIRGRMEVRGLGVVAAPSIDSAPLVLVVDLVAAREVARLPEPSFEAIGSIRLPKLALAPFESSTPAKIRLALQTLKGT